MPIALQLQILVVSVTKRLKKILKEVVTISSTIPAPFNISTIIPNSYTINKAKGD
jgi:hypothetical protein